MPSGKQTSFQYGEISPQNQYRNNDALYSTALSKLVNMQVRRAGGARKMDGLKISAIQSNQDNVPEDNIDYQRYKAFPYTYYNTTTDQEERLVMIISIPSDASSDQVQIDIKGVTIATSAGYVVDSGYGLKKVQVLQAGRRLIINGLKASFAGSTYPVMLEVPDVEASSPTVQKVSPDPYPSSFTTPSGGDGSGAATTPSGNVPAVEYIVMADHKEYGEESLARFGTSGTVNNQGFVTWSASDLMFPGGPLGIITGFYHQFTLAQSYISKLKSINVYRAPYNVATGIAASYELVYKYPINKSLLTYPISGNANIVVQLNDTGVGEVSIAPALDFSAYTTDSSNTNIVGTSTSCIYQDRHITAYDTFINNQLGAGDMAASYIGAHMGFARPTVLRNAGAFGFSVPSDDGSPVRQLVSAERLLAFTDNATYLVQGGEQGIITPFEVNPTKIATEGASKFCRPLIIGNTVIYLNATHTKVMRVVFRENSTVFVEELTRYADNFFNGETFIEMQQVPNRDDMVIFLKQDGTVFTCTVSEEGIAAFNSLELGDIKIETMSLFGVTTRPILLLYGVQNGIRYSLTIADNSTEPQYTAPAFTKNSVQYGDRILKLTEDGYVKVTSFSDLSNTPATFERIEVINITTGTTYAAGETLTVTSDVEIDVPSSSRAIYESYDQTYDRIKFFYEDGNEERFVYINIDPSTKAGAGPYTYDAVCDVDLPSYLQDVDGKSLSSEETLKRKSRWLYATKRLRAHASSDTVGLWALYLLMQDGADATPTTPDGTVDVAVRGDGVVYSSPLNPNLPDNLFIKKESGVTEPYIDFPEFITFVEIGEPYESYMETLPIERGGGETLSDDRKIVDKVGLAVYNTVGGFVGKAGDTIAEMAPLITRESVDDLSEVDTGYTGHLAPIIPSEWTREGKVKVSQVDPSPMTVLSIYPKGIIGN